MIAADLPLLWLPPKPAIIRPAEHALLRPGAFRPMTAAERDLALADLVRSKRLTPDEARRAMFFVPAAMWQSKTPPVLGTPFSNRNSSGTVAISSFGTASANRYLVAMLAAWTTSNVQFSSITIGGVAATIVANEAGSAIATAAIAIALVTSGTSGNVVATVASGSINDMGVTVIPVTNLISSSAYATLVDNTATSGQLGGTINCPALGFIVGAAQYSNNSSAGNWTWAGINKEYEPGGSLSPTTAWKTFTAAQSGLTVTATSANTTGNRFAFAAASFGNG